MLVVGAMAVIRYALRHGTRRPWLIQLLGPASRDAFFALLGLTDEGRGRGINLVITYTALEKMSVSVFRLPPWLNLDGGCEGRPRG